MDWIHFHTKISSEAGLSEWKMEQMSNELLTLNEPMYFAPIVTVTSTFDLLTSKSHFTAGA